MGFYFEEKAGSNCSSLSTAVTRETTVLVFLSLHVLYCLLLIYTLKKKKKNVFLKSITNALFNSTMPFYFTRGV